MSEAGNPYQAFAGTAQWATIDRAISDLVRDRQLQEHAEHFRIVGYVCKILAENVETAPSKPKRSLEEMRRILLEAQAEVRAANPTNRDLLAELLAERRAEAACE